MSYIVDALILHSLYTSSTGSGGDTPSPETQSWEEQSIFINFQANNPEKIKCFKRGKEVMVNSDSVNLTQQINSYDMLVFGLPKPSQTMYANGTVNVVSFTHLDSENIGHYAALCINQDGSLICRTPITENNADLDFCIHYFTD